VSQPSVTQAMLAAGRDYQALLLDALGDDDPAEAAADAPARIRALIDDAGLELRTRPAPREWSALLCIAHIADAELVWSGRYRFVLAHEAPELPGYDQDRFVDQLHGDDDDPERLLALFAALRTSNLELWRQATPAERARVGIHGERGPESFELMFRMLAGHDRIHLAQARRALDSVRS
jgi:DinB superfamily